MKAYLFVLALGCWLAGCVTPAERLDVEVIQTIREGISTRAEVEKLLDRPYSMVTGANGRTLAFYEFADFSRSGFAGPRQLLTRRLSVLYNSDFVVERKLLSASATAYHVGWRDRLGHPLDRSEVIQAMRPQVTRAELIERFGPPTVETLTIDGGTAGGWVALEQASGWRGGLREQILEVTFDENGVARDYKILGTLDRPSR